MKGSVDPIDGSAAVLDKFEIAPMGLRTVGREGGRTDGDEAIVFLHGHPGSSRDWEPLLISAGAIGRALAFDLPGFGEADKPSDWDYSTGGYGLFIGAALDVLGVKRAHLVMHDLGGTGLAWAAAHPERCASCVIMGTGVLIGFKWHPLARAMRIPGVGQLVVAVTNRLGFRVGMSYYNRQPRKLPDWFLERLWEGYGRDTRRAAMRWYRSAPPSSFERMVAFFRALDIPALVLWGRHDAGVPVRQAELQRRSFPHAEVVVLEESGHWPYIDNPEETAEHIIAFLRRQLKGAQTDTTRPATTVGLGTSKPND